MKNFKTPRPGRASMWVIAILVAGMLFSSLCGYWADFWISHDGRQIMATIAAEKSHGVLEYQYLTAGTRYSGYGQRGRNLDKEAQVGTEALIYASSSHPWLSSPQMPTFSPLTASLVIALYLWIEYYVVKVLLKMHRSSKKGLQGTPATSAI